MTDYGANSNISLSWQAVILAEHAVKQSRHAREQIRDFESQNTQNQDVLASHGRTQECTWQSKSSNHGLRNAATIAENTEAESKNSIRTLSSKSANAIELSRCVRSATEVVDSYLGVDPSASINVTGLENLQKWLKKPLQSVALEPNASTTLADLQCLMENSKTSWTLAEVVSRLRQVHTTVNQLENQAEQLRTLVPIEQELRQKTENLEKKIKEQEIHILDLEKKSPIQAIPLARPAMMDVNPTALAWRLARRPHQPLENCPADSFVVQRLWMHICGEGAEEHILGYIEVAMLNPQEPSAIAFALDACHILAERAAETDMNTSGLDCHHRTLAALKCIELTIRLGSAPAELRPLLLRAMTNMVDIEVNNVAIHCLVQWLENIMLHPGTSLTLLYFLESGKARRIREDRGGLRTIFGSRDVAVLVNTDTAMASMHMWKELEWAFERLENVIRFTADRKTDCETAFVLDGSMDVVPFMDAYMRSQLRTRYERTLVADLPVRSRRTT